MKKIVLALVSASLLAIPATSQAHTSAKDDLADFKCFHAFNRLADQLIAEGSQSDADALTGMALYFAGKIQGRNPSFDYAGLYRKNKAEIDNLDLAATAQSCLTSMESVADQLDSVYR